MTESIDQKRRVSTKHTVTIEPENDSFLEKVLPRMFPDTKTNYSRKVNKCVSIVRKAHKQKQ